VPRLCIKLYPSIRLTTEENHGKTSVGVAEKRPRPGRTVLLGVIYSSCESRIVPRGETR
jgi:hypothetical protein